MNMEYLSLSFVFEAPSAFRDKERLVLRELLCKFLPRRMSRANERYESVSNFMNQLS